jgi:hypothetical protein
MATTQGLATLNVPEWAQAIQLVVLDAEGHTRSHWVNLPTGVHRVDLRASDEWVCTCQCGCKVCAENK